MTKLIAKKDGTFQVLHSAEHQAILAFAEAIAKRHQFSIWPGYVPSH